jgi:membrane-associated protease RseP (regulator of RpoE activity)
MNVQLAAKPPDWARGTAAKLPERFPPFNTPLYYVFSILWLAALVLAVLGPVMGLYDRYTSPADNSQLFMGSRAGIAVAPRDATYIRFTVGNEAREAGIRPGDKIIAIYGLPMPPVMPVTEQALAAHGQDPAYVAMDNLLFGTDRLPFPLTVRSADGKVHDVTVTTDEQHIKTAASSVGVPPILLSFVDVIHVIFYPFLLWAAWILHRRNARDVVSSVLSLAILLMIGSELPSSAYLGEIGVPRAVNVALYDLSNILLLAGILLFPHGELSWPKVGLLLALPVLMLLHGSLYQTYLAAFMILAALTLLRHLRRAENSETLQQIRWALLGFSGYAVLRALSILADYFKWSTGSFGQQLSLEILAGLTLALGVLVLQFGLLIALVRYRLYDAEFVISKSANYALITLVVAAIFAGVADALKQIVYNYYGNTNSEGPVIMAAALSTVLVNPIQERIQSWSEKRFQKNLVLLRDDLPDCVRDMRETASLTEMVDEILARVDRGVRAVRSAVIVSGRVLRARDISTAEVSTWRQSDFADDYASDICEPKDKVFPIRVPLVPSSDKEAPIGFLLVGPRPDGSIPSRDEQKALAGVSEDVARAIRTVVKREAREAEVAKLIADNARRIAALEAMLGKTGAGVRKPPAKA